MAKKWYRDGLAFECTRCGKCCGGEPGFVWVNEEELEAIASHQDESVEDVIANYTHMNYGRRSLREKANNDCIFYETGVGCTIYEIRPRQCRTWPFWESTASTPEAWERTKSVCPGAGQGELISAEEITARIRVIKI